MNYDYIIIFPTARVDMMLVETWIKKKTMNYDYIIIFPTARVDMMLVETWIFKKFTKSDEILQPMLFSGE